MTSSDVWDEQTASVFEEESVQMFAKEMVDPAVDFLAHLAGTGRALEFAIGTGRIAIPLLERGVSVTGVELSAPMTARLRTKVSATELPVVLGDMATTKVAGKFSLVYLLWNSIANLRTQKEQVSCFSNAARHLDSGGHFVIELFVPPLRRLPPGQVAVPFEVTDRHTGVDTIDASTQETTSHHYTRQPDGTVRHGVGHFRYIWPAECDLMAQLAGMSLENRFADWKGNPFTHESENHVSIWRKS